MAIKGKYVVIITAIGIIIAVIPIPSQSFQLSAAVSVTASTDQIMTCIIST